MSPRRYVALVFLAVGVVWLLINKRFNEGPMLWHFAEGHALMATDLISLAAWAAALTLWSWPQHRPELVEPRGPGKA